jgi:hypothetical protein
MSSDAWHPKKGFLAPEEACLFGSYGFSLSRQETLGFKRLL